MLVANPAAERRERIEQDAPDQHATAAEAIGEIPAKQAERAADNRGDPEEQPDPVIELGRSGPRAGQLADRRSDDERGHQDFVDVECETEGGNGADQPLHGSQP